MKDKDLLALYGTGSQKVVKLLKAMRAVITEIKERVKLLKEPKGTLKKNSYPEDKPHRSR